jgi:N-acyl-D-aspartate/D-glutamate deacylase
MRDATARGHFTASDVYPYLAGQTSLSALIIPAWAQDGGTNAMRARFADPAQRARIVAEAEQAMDARFGSAQGVYLPASGRRLVDVMEELGVSHGEAVVRLLEEGGNQPAILSFGVEEDLLELLRYPDAAIACDCGATESTRTHPRNYGTYPRVLGRYVRETQALTWEDAIRKMTGLPASLLGMIDRGFLAAGMAADITVFDPSTVIDHASYEEPAQYSEGIRHVLVNGRFALRDGAPTGERAGRTLIRTVHLPSRPMSTSASRPAAIAEAVAAAGVLLELSDEGLLQTAPGWLGWTGMARTAQGHARGVRVVIDDTGPNARRTIVEVDGDGGSF